MKKFIIFSVILTIIVAIVFVFALLNLSNTDKTYDNIFIEDLDVSNKTSNDIREELYDRFKFETAVIEYNGKQWEIDLSDLGFSYKIDEAIQEAFSIGRNENLFRNFLKIISLKFGDKEYINLQYNHKYSNLEKHIQIISQDLSSEPVDAKISAVNGKVDVKAGKDGKKVDIAKLVDYLKIEIEKKDNKKIEVQIPFITKSPNIRYNQLKEIDGIISSYETDFRSSDYARAFNVDLTAKKVDNQLIFPNEEISFITKVGDINVASGFKQAKVIFNNEYRLGVGGGVCQVSSTLYNALLEGGIEITERKNHSLPVMYVPIGRDATVADLSLDLKYKNTYDFPIFIRTYTENRKMKVEIYGNTSKAKKVELFTETIPIYPRVIYRNDSSTNIGIQKVSESGSIGYKATTYKIEDGKKIIISQDWYAAKPRIILVGTKPISN